jgi:uncharacterized protein (DUF427 family)
MTDTHARGRVRVEKGLKRVRAYVGGELVVDTTHPLLVWENPNYPAYYLPRADVVAALVPTATSTHSPSRGDTVQYTVKAGGKELVDAAWQYPESPLEEIRDHVRFDWQALDAWFEEDEEVYVHARDPYKRIDALRSSRHVEVRVRGVTVADTRRPVLLFETGLPTRYYIPKLDVRLDLLRPSEKVTACPYKGTASYFSLHLPDQTDEADLAWVYPMPIPQIPTIANHLAFFNERVDLVVDGELQTRPKTVWS